MEQLRHYVWKHKLFPLHELFTHNGQAVDVIDTGLHNTDAGPDFFNAKIRIGDTLWVGNVEIHDRPDDWYLHGHEKDTAYDNVVLHVVGETGAPVFTKAGRELPQLVLPIPETIARNYRELIAEDRFPPCHRLIPSLSRLTLHSWMASLQAERLERKTADILQRLSQAGGDWEKTYFVTLARNFGFGINGEAFEQWAWNIPLSAAAHHRDHQQQIEALFMGQAGLLTPESVTEKHREATLTEEYFLQLKTEYAFLTRKFHLSPMSFKLWRFLRLRPQNFPYLRIAQLAALYCKHRTSLRKLLECTDVKALEQLFEIHVSPYWETHYSFGAAGTRQQKRLSAASLRLLLINTAIPTLFAYGRSTAQEALCVRAFDLLDGLQAENNHIVRMWKACGLTVKTAADSQALIQLKREYCEKKDCLRCRIGYEYLKRKA